MKILIASDSHGNTQALLELIKIFPDCSLYLHAGDSEDTECSLFPFETVKGNCDYYDIAYTKRIFNSPYGQILLTHFPDSKLNPETKIYIHGHTHKMRAENQDGIIIINPGSISFSKDKEGESYAILDIDDKGAKASFYSLNDNKIIKKVSL